MVERLRFHLLQYCVLNLRNQQKTRLPFEQSYKITLLVYQLNRITFQVIKFRTGTEIRMVCDRKSRKIQRCCFSKHRRRFFSFVPFNFCFRSQLVV